MRPTLPWVNRGWSPRRAGTPYQALPGVNHLAYEVDDVEALRNRMKSAGYRVNRRSACVPVRLSNVVPAEVCALQLRT